jgi:hypothetical protein
MESTAAQSRAALSAGPARPGLALALALLSVPGSTLAWDLFDPGGFVIGLPLAIAAIVLGVQSRQRSREGRGKALAAIVIGGAMLAMMVVWTSVESL